MPDVRDSYPHGAVVEVDGAEYVIVRDTRYCENAILSGRAILVDVGEPLRVWAVPVDDDDAP